MEFELRKPKIDDFVRLTTIFITQSCIDDFTKYAFLYQGLHKVINIEQSKINPKRIKIYTNPSVYNNCSFISVLNDGYTRSRPRHIPVLEVLVLNNKPNLYCSCSAPKLKENWVLNKMFYICLLCGKEKQ